MARRAKAIVCALALSAAIAQAQRAAVPDRIAGHLEGTRSVRMQGYVHRLATAENDRGRADAAMPIEAMTMTFAPSVAQQAELDALLARQQDPASPDYHQWLTPDEFGARFGLSENDLAAVRGWLEGQGLTVISVARGRNSISFKGSAGQVESAFATQIRRYFAQGEMHFANATEPALPEALSGVVSSIRGLHDFRLRTHATRRMITEDPHHTSAKGNHYLAPDDIATIYDVKALYAQNVDGTGQKVAVVGQSAVPLTDITSFRATYNLPANPPTMISVPNLPVPGQVAGDLGESELDLEVIGGVARGASVIFVFSQYVQDAQSYVVDNNLAPVMSSSYGYCESGTGQNNAASDRALAQQANALGITWVNASGDNGAVDCFSSSARTSFSLAVDEPADIPEVTGVGGTEFNDGSGNYWNSTDDANSASARSWIPEIVWNDSVADGEPSASGGGASTFFSKPSWQTGAGVPSDGARDVPDLSFAASADHDGYLILSSDCTDPSCPSVLPTTLAFGGTSAATPLFAGILTLLNQYQVANGFLSKPGLGNVNPHLYAMAGSAPGAFHDITTGNNAVDPCPSKARGCTTTPIGFNAGVGYDQASGLGSLDAFNFVTMWQTGASKTTATMTLNASVTSITQSGSTILSATITGSGPAPTGSVTWSVNGTTLGVVTLVGTGNSAKASLIVSGANLGTGNLTISASWPGDSNYTGTSGTLALTVTSTRTNPSMVLSSASATIAQSATASLTATLTGTGATLPTGSVTWSLGSVNVGSATLSASGGKAVATLSVSASSLSVGSLTLTATYAGDTNYNPASGTLPLTVTAVPPAVAALTSAASFKAAYAPGMIMTVWGTGLSTSTASATAAALASGQYSLPTTLAGATATINGVAAPLYYVSPALINLQIPYSTAVGTASLKITANGQTTTSTFNVGAAAPGIFFDSATGAPVPNESATRGQFVTLYITGDGAASPAPATGITPPAGVTPVPLQSVSVTVGGVVVPSLAFIGIPSWSIGLTQLNFAIPATVGLGAQPVIVTVGGVPSASATITITQ